LDVLINEVEHLQRLRHPHIVQLVGSYLQGKKFAILLYPATEGNLATFYEMCGPENTAEGLLGHEKCLVALHRFFRRLASSLAYIHADTTKHLDITPQNVLLIFYRADFGISRHFQSHDLSQTGSLLARTRKYCAPEVYDGEARGRAADVFSLGCIFLEMTT
ncbi:kinase-like domain-containing protein, partial [Leptodontidium sp. 2 PMI_412]